MYLVNLFYKNEFVTKVTIRSQNKMTDEQIEEFIQNVYPLVLFDRMEVSYVD